MLEEKIPINPEFLREAGAALKDGLEIPAHIPPRERELAERLVEFQRQANATIPRTVRSNQRRGEGT